MPREDDPQAEGVALEEVASGFERPILVTHAGDGSGRLFIVEQVGVIRVIKEGVVQERPFLDIRDQVSSGGERGLLGLAFQPEVVDERAVFVSYTDREGDSVLARFEVDPDDRDRLITDSQTIILTQAQPYSNHNGGHIVFGPDGMLYYGLGDGGSGGDPKGNAQDLSTLLGSILRIAVVGTDGYGVPGDNPFVGQDDARPEIWLYGLRNPWRFSFDDANGALWIGDVGQGAVEEIDRIGPDNGGANLGWDRFEGNRHFEGRNARAGLTFPVVTYDRVDGNCAVTGGYVYRGSDVPALEGAYVFADYCSGRVWTWREEGRRAFLLMDTDHQVSSFGTDEAGELYLVDHGGSIHRFVAA
ncbi:MAG: PQQ-dependent sugar dehydrogenase [Euryarchaeota archaeon]|nr:PQQ-dependent sugar dehydrogenase [Euryarchaeota archaeon]